MARRLRLLWVTPYLPQRGVSAAREHWWSLLACLAPRHDITLLAFVDDEDEAPVRQLPASLSALRLVPRRPWRPDDPFALLPRTVAGHYADPAFGDAIAEQLGAGRYDLVQYECIEMANLVPRASLPSVLAVPQVGFAQEGPRWRAEGRPLRRAGVLLHRYLRELDFGLRAVRRVHHVITVSPQDADRLQRFEPRLRVSVSPLGVDGAFFVPRDPDPLLATDLLFVGNFSHPPNVDAARFLITAVLPLIGGRPSTRIVGHGAERVAGTPAGGGVTVTGPVPDLRPHLAAARVVVAPVRFGTGMRGKVLEGLAMGRPVVTTSLGAEGLDAEPGTHILVADDAAGCASAIRRVLDDPAFGARLGSAGRRLVESRFGWSDIAAHHEGLWERIVADPGEPLEWTEGPAIAPGLSALARAGRWPAIGTGTGILLARALRWHLRARRNVRAMGPGRTPAGVA